MKLQLVENNSPDMMLVDDYEPSFSFEAKVEDSAKFTYSLLEDQSGDTMDTTPGKDHEVV